MTWVRGMVAIDGAGRRWRVHNYNGGWECLPYDSDALGIEGAALGDLSDCRPDLSDWGTIGHLMRQLEGGQTISGESPAGRFWGLVWPGDRPAGLTIGEHLMRVLEADEA